jgi:hypothetical protein
MIIDVRWKRASILAVFMSVVIILTSLYLYSIINRPPPESWSADGFVFANSDEMFSFNLSPFSSGSFSFEQAELENRTRVEVIVDTPFEASVDSSTISFIMITDCGTPHSSYHLNITHRAELISLDSVLTWEENESIPGFGWITVWPLNETIKLNSSTPTYILRLIWIEVLTVRDDRRWEPFFQLNLSYSVKYLEILEPIDMRPWSLLIQSEIVVGGIAIITLYLKDKPEVIE